MRVVWILSGVALLAGVGARVNTALWTTAPVDASKPYEEMSYTDKGKVITAKFTERIKKAGAVDCAVDSDNEQCRDRGPSAKLDCNDQSEICLVYVDRDKLTQDQDSKLEEMSRNFPPTEIGKQCVYYSRSEIWCLLLRPPQAKEVYSQLQQFGVATGSKDVRRLGNRGERS